MQDWQDILGDGLAVTLELPIAPSDRSPTAPDVAARLLDAIAVLEAEPNRSSDELVAPELVRLELKLDLLMDLVTTLLVDQLPRCVPIHLSASGIVLPAAVLPSTCTRLAIYPCHWLAQPLVLELHHHQIRGTQCGAHWQSPDLGLHEVLRRWVFRVHRREVARRRLHANAAGDDALFTASEQQDGRR
jgi:hypothetical protein